MIIRKFEKEGAKEVSKLVSKPFTKFVAPGFTKRELRNGCKNKRPKNKILK